MAQIRARVAAKMGIRPQAVYLLDLAWANAYAVPFLGWVVISRDVPDLLTEEEQQAQREARVEAEGKRVLARVEKAKGDLEAMLEGIEITRLDLLNLETQMYERAAATGVLEYGSHIEKLRDMKKKKQGFRVWPWQGEYWADELGWYVFDARPDCPESMARGDAQGAP